MADLRRGKKEYRALSQDRRNAMIADYCQVVKGAVAADGVAILHCDRRQEVVVRTEPGKDR